MIISSPKRPVCRGFTLVEMLVVVAIIGVIAGLVTVAASRVLKIGKQTVIVTDFNQIDMALAEYKNKHGEYPPDGTDTSDLNNNGIPDSFERHFQRVFPKANLYKEPISGQYVSELGILYNVYKLPCKPDDRVALGNFFANYTPSTALAFWLGGMQEDDYSVVATKNPKSRFVGFSTNPMRPLSEFTPTGSRLPLWFEFDATRITDPAMPSAVTSTTIFRQYLGNVNVPLPYVYFRAELKQQQWEYTNWSIATRPVKSFGSAKPYFDTTQATAAIPGRWINPTSYQLLFCGFDNTFGSGNCYPTGIKPTKSLPPPYNRDLILFPYKANPSDTSQFDDITSFAGGTVGDKIP